VTVDCKVALLVENRRQDTLILDEALHDLVQGVARNPFATVGWQHQ